MKGRGKERVEYNDDTMMFVELIVKISNVLLGTCTLQSVQTINSIQSTPFNPPVTRSKYTQVISFHCISAVTLTVRLD